MTSHATTKKKKFVWTDWQPKPPDIQEDDPLPRNENFRTGAQGLRTARSPKRKSPKMRSMIDSNRKKSMLKPNNIQRYVSPQRRRELTNDGWTRTSSCNLKSCNKKWQEMAHRKRLHFPKRRRNRLMRDPQGRNNLNLPRQQKAASQPMKKSKLLSSS